jgi:hypothetical protein
MIEKFILKKDKRRIDILGKRFGRLLVQQLTTKRAKHPTRIGPSLWKCKCTCGNYILVPSSALRRGFTTSCGCLRKETGKKLGKRSKLGRLNPAYKHGIYCDPTKKHLVKKLRRNAGLLKYYNITFNNYNEMYKKQDGRCKICNKFGIKHTGILTLPKKGLFVDHDHKTGKVRGLLCHTCNHLLGFAQDNPAILTQAIKYLQETI